MSSTNSPNRLGVVEAARAIERNELRCVDLTQACLDRIAERNPDVEAFVAYDADKALAVARGLDAAPSGHPLRGIPFAVKDVIDTSDYPTQYGSPIYKNFQPALDAACVVMAKSHGGVLLGKVATGEFATQTPSRARNPLRLTHTPGGSSSGSAAAVADYMVPAAFATQTTGSIVRPAIYCGVVGYKPSFGLIATAGLKALSPSQDTIGVIARKVEDAAFFTLGLHGAKTVNSVVAKPRIALCLSRQWDYVKPETLRALESLVHKLELAGCAMSRIWLPEDLERLVAIQPRLFKYEARQTLANERLLNKELLSPRLRARLQGGDDLGFDEYVSMRQQVREAHSLSEELFRDVDAVLYPAAAGEAEEGLESAGDPRFGALWTLLHLPSISFPTDLGPAGLPLGAQLIGGFAQDTRLLAVANAVTRMIEPVQG
jgi:Asp-tRNA(Asn)/Glu-tRNA(Gln) amidotransferase A subunit family amidase